MLMLCNYSVDASVRIQNIKYQGNMVTDEVLLNNALYIKSGDELIYALVEKSKQSIMDIGMFKSVRFYVNKIESNEYFDETE